jgi:hypothetical protein
VRRADRAGKPVLRHDCKTAAAGLVERRIGRDDRDRRIGTRQRGGTGRKILGIERG